MKTNLLLTFLISSMGLNSQIFYSEYLISYTDSITYTEKSKLVRKYKMEIYSNPSYSFYKLITIVSETNELKYSRQNDETFIIDYKKETVYDIKNASYHRYDRPDKIPIKSRLPADTLYTELISRNKDSVWITFQKYIPKYVCANIVLWNNLHGVKEIKTKKRTIRLLKFIRVTDFDFQKSLNVARKLCKQKGKNINNLFQE